jgi:hypothetical protein
VVLRFILDHAQDSTGKPGAARDVAMELITRGLRVALDCPAPATLDHRIASWRAFQRMRNLTSPFSAPLVQKARQKARRVNARPHVPKSPIPVTRNILEALLSTCDDGRSGIRDRIKHPGRNYNGMTRSCFDACHRTVAGLIDAFAPDPPFEKRVVRVMHGHKLADMGRMTLRWPAGSPASA